MLMSSPWMFTVHNVNINSRYPSAQFIPAHISGYDLYRVGKYIWPQGHNYHLWRLTWDLTEEEDYIHGYAT
jgi:hypothetical protein